MPQHSFLLLSGILLSDSAQLSETIPLFLSQQSDYRFPEYQFRVCSSSIPPIRLRGWHLSRILPPSCLIAVCAALHPVLVPFYVLNGIPRGVTFPEDRPQMLLHSSQIPPSVMSSLFNKKCNRSGPSAMDSCFPHSRISPPFICLFWNIQSLNKPRPLDRGLQKRYFTPHPFGFIDCQLQESAHIRRISLCAFHFSLVCAFDASFHHEPGNRCRKRTAFFSFPSQQGDIGSEIIWGSTWILPRISRFRVLHLG